MRKFVPFFFTAAYVLSFFIIFEFFLPSEVKEKISNHDNVIKTDGIAYNAVPYPVGDYKVLDTYTGELTGYGPDCVGCGGKTGCSPAQDVRNGNIYYNDTYYGKLRIVASDANLSCGSIVRITASNIYNEPILAIVLDRGGKIKDNKFDLLYESEAAAMHAGLQKNVKYEILRYGW